MYLFKVCKLSCSSKNLSIKSSRFSCWEKDSLRHAWIYILAWASIIFTVWKSATLLSIFFTAILLTYRLTSMNSWMHRVMQFKLARTYICSLSKCGFNEFTRVHPAWLKITAAPIMHGAIKKKMHTRLHFDPWHGNIESGRRKLIATRRARTNDEYCIGAPCDGAHCLRWRRG